MKNIFFTFEKQIAFNLSFSTLLSRATCCNLTLNHPQYNLDKRFLTLFTDKVGIPNVP